MPNQVRIGVGVTGAKGAASEMDRLRDKFTALQKGGTKGFAIGVGAAITTKALGVLGAAIGGVTGFLEDSRHAYQEQEVATTRLTASLKANVAGWNGNMDAINAATEAGIKLGFKDTETADAIALLVAATHDEAEALHVLAVAQDLARFKGISLADAAQALTSIEAGRSRGLAQLGINVKDYATTEERLAAVEKVAGGQAQKYATTDLGAVDAAYAKIEQSQEKFGKGLSKIEAVVLPAAADALDVATRGYGTFETAQEAAANGSQAAQVRMATLASVAKDAGISVEEAFTLMSQGVALNADAMRKAASTATGLDKWTGKLADDEARASTKTSGLTGDLGDLEQQTKDTTSAISDLSSTVEDELFGKAITAGNEARLRENISDLEKQREAAHKGSLKWIELTGQIAENRKALFELHLTEAAARGPQAAIAFLKSEESHAGDAKDEIGALIKKYQALADLQGDLGPIIVVGGAAHGPAKKHARGGHMAAGEPGIVGEEGPEMFVPDTGGTIIPNGSRVGGAGGSVNVNVNVAGATILTPALGAAIAREIGPHIADYLRRRGFAVA